MGTADIHLNRLLALMQQQDQDVLRPHLEPVTLEYKRLLYNAYERIGFVYFVEEGVASLVSTLANGDAAEVGTIGNQGIVGFPVLMGDEQAPTSVYIQVPGSGLRIRAQIYQQELDRSGPMRAVILRYAHAFFNAYQPGMLLTV